MSRWGEDPDILRLGVELTPAERTTLYAEALMHGVTMEELAHQRVVNPTAVSAERVIEALERLAHVRNAVHHMNLALMLAYGEKEDMAADIKASLDAIVERLTPLTR